VLRLLNRASSLLPLAALGMAAAMRTQFEALLRESHGLIIVCGPTGSGKTTTLYAAIRQMDTVSKNVVTIEEPIEYELPNIGQMQVKPKIGLTFARGLRHILRQDPDVILVGETRDAETAEIAVRASLTGHLVFTTLHTNDSASAVIRMMDMGVESYMLAAALRASLAQRLVRKLCPACRSTVALDPADLAGLGKAAERLQGGTVFRPVGCPACLGGYRGRLGLYELLVVDDDLQEVIRQGPGAAKSMWSGTGARRGPTLLDDGIDKVLAGETNLAEVLYALGHLSG
jgi:general secretion pathway protein E